MLIVWIHQVFNTVCQIYQSWWHLKDIHKVSFGTHDLMDQPEQQWMPSDNKESQH